MKILTRLKYRNAFKVGTAYIVVGWLLLQIADVLLSNFNAPDWVFKSFALVLMLGLPLALILAWALELSPDGARYAHDHEFNPALGNETQKKPLLTGSSVFVAIVVVLLAIWLVLGQIRVISAGFALDSVGINQAETSGLVSKPGRSRLAEHAIAVLPFSNLSADPEQAFFTDGVTEDILNRLSSVPGLRVISRTSVMRYKNSQLTIPEMAEELNVDYILEGSVRRVENRVRVSGQLIDADGDYQLWASSYDRELADIFSIQAEIAQRIVQELEINLSGPERARIADSGTTNTGAYELYIRGRALLDQSFHSIEDILRNANEAEILFRTALTIDSHYSDAMAGIARAINFTLPFLAVDKAEARYQEALAAAHKAVGLSPQRSVGYVELGRLYSTYGLRSEALEQYQLAVRFDNNNVDALVAMSRIYSARGRYLEAYRKLLRAASVDPNQVSHQVALANLFSNLGAFESMQKAAETAFMKLTRQRSRYQCYVAVMASNDGRELIAKKIAEELFEVAKHSEIIAGCMLLTSLQLGDIDLAAKYLALHREFIEARFPIQAAQVVAIKGTDEELERVLLLVEKNLERGFPRITEAPLAFTKAQILLLRGDKDGALEYLMKAASFGARMHNVFNLPMWEALEDNPRFQQLKQINHDDIERMRKEVARAGGFEA